MSDRLTDIAHQDELNRMKVRLRALSVAAESIAGASDEVFTGYHQLIVDAADAMQRCAEAFDAERCLRQKNVGGMHG